MQTEAYVNEADKLDIINIEAIDTIDFNNCHLVVKYLLHKDKDLCEAIMNEFEAQMRFGDKDESKSISN